MKCAARGVRNLADIPDIVQEVFLRMLRVPDQPLMQNLLDISQWISLLAILSGAMLFTFAPRVEVR